MFEAQSYLMKRVGVGDVVDHDGDGGITNVRGNERSEPLLTGCVPQLQPHRSILKVHRLGQAINADGGLVSVVEGVIHESGDQ